MVHIIIITVWVKQLEHKDNYTNCQWDVLHKIEILLQAIMEL